MANVEFSTGKSVFVLTVVAACFAILWPKVFYPIIMGTPTPKRPADSSAGCCDVLFETDVKVIRVLSEMCSRVTGIPEGAVMTPARVAVCRAAVLQRCNIDIAAFLNEQVKLGRSSRQILDELRSFNTSVCLRLHFGVSPASLGAPRQMRTWESSISRHLRQERPPHLRPESLHPALRERGRAIPPIPASHVAQVIQQKDPSIKPPLPGMRPPMGGAGHVVPAPKTGGTMSIVMPLYTIGIVIFFMYTIMKVFVRKNTGQDALRDFQSDPEFSRVVFAAADEDESQQTEGKISGEPLRPYPLIKAPSKEATRLDWKERDTIMTAIGGLLAEVDRHLEATPGEYSQSQHLPKSTPSADPQETTKPVEESTPVVQEHKQEQQQEATTQQVDISEIKGESPSVRVIGVETRAHAEGGGEWHLPASATLGLSHSRPSTPLPPEPEPEPHNIFLKGSLPSQSQLLVEDAATELLRAQPQDPAPAVILSGKMTLSLISVDAHPPVPNPNTLPEAVSVVGRTKNTQQQQQQQQQSTDGPEPEPEPELDEETDYTTADLHNTSLSVRQDAEADDTAADVSAHDLLDDDQEDMQEEYDAIWGAIEMDDSESNKKLQ